MTDQSVTLDSLYESRCKTLPDGPGIYMVIAPEGFAPLFLDRGTGGWFKGKDPNVPVENLRSRWVQGARDLYIGMTEWSLRTRVWDLLRFGHGELVPHWGGRHLWQLKDSGKLLLRWREHEAPVREEARLLEEFESRYGRLPFANRKRGEEKAVVGQSRRGGREQ
jgi:hypothetical protein